MQICTSYTMYAFQHRSFSVDTLPRSFAHHHQTNSQSPDGKRIALSSESGHVFIFDIESGSLVTTYTSHAMAVRSLAWSYDGQVSLVYFFDINPAEMSCSYFLQRQTTSDSSCTTSVRQLLVNQVLVQSRRSPATHPGY